MKIMIRALAAALLVAGLISATRTLAVPAAKIAGVTAGTQSMPIPVCPPNDPNGCHIDKW